MPQKTILGLAGLLRRPRPLSVMIFHRVLRQPDPLLDGEPDAARFEEQMRWVSAWFNVLPLDEAVTRLKNGSLPPRAMAITFDDGYTDNHDVALPILTKLGLSATFFVATGYLNGGRMFNDTVIESIRALRGTEFDGTDLGIGRLSFPTDRDRARTIDQVLRTIKYLPQNERQRTVDRLAERAGLGTHSQLMMSDAQVHALGKAGMLIGGHTMTHPILAKTAPDTARREIAEGKRRLEDITGRPVRLFAYPNGRPNVDYDRTHVDMVRELGFDAAFSTAPGALDERGDPFQIPRFTPWDRSKSRYAVRLAANILATRVEYA